MDKTAMIENVYQRRYKNLYDFCVAYIGGNPRDLPDVDDCLQDAFLFLLRKADHLQDEQHAYATAVFYCKNRFKALHRKRKRQEQVMGTHVSLETLAETGDCVDDVLKWCVRHDHLSWINGLLETLTEKEREVFQVYYVQDCSVLETCARLGVNENSVKGSAYRIRQKAMQYKNFVILLFIANLFGISRHL